MLCPHFGKCGGCQMQDKPYNEQFEWKINQVYKIFFREPDEAYPSPRIWYYRNRMDYVVGPGYKVGLKERGKWWAYVDLKECYLMSPEANEIKNIFREFIREKRWIPWDTVKHKGFARYIVIREGKFTNQRMVIAVTYKPKDPEKTKKELLEFKEMLDERKIKVDSLYLGINPTWADVSYSYEKYLVFGKEYIEEEILGNKYLISPNSFFQTNSYTAEILLEKAIELLDLKGDEIVYDLYAGAGFFSVEIAKNAKKVVGVEIERDSIELFKKNFEINGLNNYEIIEKKVEELKEIKADKVIIDPPRAGMHPKAVRMLIRSKPKHIVYVSCNPKTQYRDIRQLQKVGYELEYLVMIDQFPHTIHVEAIALLKLK